MSDVISESPAPAETSAAGVGVPAGPLPKASLAAAALTTAGLFLAGLQFPYVIALAPLPLLRLGLRRGPVVQGAGAAAALAGVSAVLLAFSSDPMTAAVVVALFAAIILLPVRIALRGVIDGWGIGRTLVSIVAVEAAWVSLVGAWVSRRFDLRLGDELAGAFDRARIDVIQTLTSGGVSASWIADFDRNFRESTQFWSTRYTLLVVIAFALLLAFVLSLVPRLSGRPDDPSLKTFRFEEFRNPFVLVVGFVVGGVGTALTQGPERIVASNLLLATLVLCFLQGFSVVYAFLARIPVGRFFRCFVYFVMILLSPVTVAVAGIGLFDEFFEFRRFRP